VIKSVLITGANAGLGKECARQLALQDGTEKIYLACRNEERAQAAKLELEDSTGKSVFEIFLIDVSNLNSVRAAVESLSEPIDGLVMNAGGMGGKNFDEKTVDGVTEIFAQNLLGHVVLAEALLKAKKLTKVALYAGSEAARGIPKVGMKRPNLKNSSVEEFVSVCDGSFFKNKIEPFIVYGPIKYMAALWMSSLARMHPDIRFVTISPGQTSGTNLMKDFSPFMKFMFKFFGLRLLPMFGLLHNLEVGAKRFVDGLNDKSYKSGVFYGSKASVLTGLLVDQGTIFDDLNNKTFQDNAYEAIHRFIN
jgi:NAD(P)-dependent dehydrogenase (short-subunit alcohol dehydrogenase family)